MKGSDFSMMRALGPRLEDPGEPQPAGTGALTFSSVAEGTVVTRCVARSPLRLLQPRNHGHAAWVFTSSYGGGLVSGDVIDLRLTVERGATALLSTQASTKVYRSHGSPTALDPGCTQQMQAEVAEGGLLVLAPDPVVCFADARFSQTQHIRLAAEGSLLLMDAVTSGRHANGERWAFSSLESRVEIYQAGQKCVHESLRLATVDGPLAARLGRMNVLMFAVLLGPRVRGQLPALRDELTEVPIGHRSDLLLSCSPLPSRSGDPDGLIVRIGATNVEQAVSYLRQRLRFLPALLGDDPWARKW